MKRPDLATVPPFYHTYINLVAGEDLNAALQESKAEISTLLAGIPEEKWTFRYAAGKWSIKELVLHIADTERIFAYRALCIARGETASLPGFDENNYAAASLADQRSKASLLNELKTVQEATLTLFESFTEDQLERSGMSNNKPIQVRAIGFIAAGHIRHHKNILQERYLS